MSRIGVEVVSVNGADVGRFGAFLIGFRNYYFTVDGPCPLSVAEALYATPVGRTDIRAGGNCTCPAPRTQATYYDSDGNELVSDPGDKQAREWDAAIAKGGPLATILANVQRPRFVPDAAAMAARAVVNSFHVDSELGLYMLLQALRAEVKK